MNILFYSALFHKAEEGGIWIIFFQKTLEMKSNIGYNIFVPFADMVHR